MEEGRGNRDEGRGKRQEKGVGRVRKNCVLGFSSDAPCLSDSGQGRRHSRIKSRKLHFLLF